VSGAFPQRSPHHKKLISRPRLRVVETPHPLSFRRSGGVSYRRLPYPGATLRHAEIAITLIVGFALGLVLKCDPDSKKIDRCKNLTVSLMCRLPLTGTGKLLWSRRQEGYSGAEPIASQRGRSSVRLIEEIARGESAPESATVFVMEFIRRVTRGAGVLMSFGRSSEEDWGKKKWR
jgi:hypothetical protein